jgi:hypothetical protein
LNATGRGRRDGSLIPLVPPGGTPLAGSLLVVSQQSRATRLPPAGNWVRFSCSISPLFVLSHNMPIVNTTSKLALFWRFSHAAIALPSVSLTISHSSIEGEIDSSLIPSPLSHWFPLREAYPHGETTGFLRSPSRSTRGEVVPLGRWCTIRDGGIRSPRT